MATKTLYINNTWIRIIQISFGIAAILLFVASTPIASAQIQQPTLDTIIPYINEALQKAELTPTPALQQHFVREITGGNITTAQQLNAEIERIKQEQTGQRIPNQNINTDTLITRINTTLKTIGLSATPETQRFIEDIANGNITTFEQFMNNIRNVMASMT